MKVIPLSDHRTDMKAGSAAPDWDDDPWRSGAAVMLLMVLAWIPFIVLGWIAYCIYELWPGAAHLFG